MRRILIVLSTMLTLVTACKQSPGNPTVDVDRLAGAYAELLVLNERYNLSKDSLSSPQYVAEYQDILRKYRMTKEEYTAQFQTVSASSGLYQQLCDRALTKIQQMRTNPDTTRTKGRS